MHEYLKSVTCTEAIDKNLHTLDVARLGGEEQCSGLVATIFGIHVAATRTAEGRLLLQKQLEYRCMPSLRCHMNSIEAVLGPLIRYP